MADTFEMLRRFGSRLRQVHLSEVTTNCQHERPSLTAIIAFRAVASMLSERIPVIIESVMGIPPTLGEMTDEIERAQRALPCSDANLAKERPCYLPVISANT
jgi:hypothetical protein